MDNKSIPIRKSSKRFCIILVVAIFLALAVLAFLLFLIIQKGGLILNLNVNQTVNKPLTDLVVSSDDPYEGSDQAKVVIVEFSDYECPYCFQEFSVVREIINIYGDKIKFIYRDFPLFDKHPNAQKAAEAGECAHEQGKFWEMHDKMFINHDRLDTDSLKIYAQQIGLNEDQFNQCLVSDKYKNEVENDLTEGVLAGVSGTPAFFINGYKIEGAISLEDFKKAIDLILGEE